MMNPNSEQELPDKVSVVQQLQLRRIYPNMCLNISGEEQVSCMPVECLEPIPLTWLASTTILAIE